MKQITLGAFFGLVLASSSAALSAGSKAPSEDSAASLIRKSAGQSDPSMAGQLSLTRVGHHPGDPWVSLVANKSGAIWEVSYACAFSYRCSSNSDHKSANYRLSLQQSAQVDALIARIKEDPNASRGPEQGMLSSSTRLSVNLPDLKKDFRNDSAQNNVLDELQSALTAPLS